MSNSPAGVFQERSRRHAHLLHQLRKQSSRKSQVETGILPNGSCFAITLLSRGPQRSEDDARRATSKNKPPLLVATGIFSQARFYYLKERSNRVCQGDTFSGTRPCLGLSYLWNRCTSVDRPLPAGRVLWLFSSESMAGGGSSCSPVVPAAVENLLTQRTLPAMF